MVEAIDDWEQRLVKVEDQEASVVELVVVVGRQRQACSSEFAEGFWKSI